jgi:hypothetical protein
MKARLEADGRTAESKVAVLAYGADGLKSIVQAAIQTPPRSILGLFYSSMRLRHVEPMAPKVACLFWEATERLWSAEHRFGQYKQG